MWPYIIFFNIVQPEVIFLFKDNKNVIKTYNKGYNC
jgi:hypothetical protein